MEASKGLWQLIQPGRFRRRSQGSNSSISSFSSFLLRWNHTITILSLISLPLPASAATVACLFRDSPVGIRRLFLLCCSALIANERGLILLLSVLFVRFDVAHLPTVGAFTCCALGVLLRTTLPASRRCTSVGVTVVVITCR